MTATCYDIGSLVLRIENGFLDTPGLALTLPTAQQQFGVDPTTCKAVLDALVDARVLAQTRAGAYVRHFPRRARHAA